ncbi:MAG: glycosyltransferase [Planctomycetes bacterium]|nr:glycosyltransferase [Planctomycetota bacterium]
MRLQDTTSDARLRALIKNDLAALDAAQGQIESAMKGFQMALALNPDCEPARLNLALLEADISLECRGQPAEGPARKTEDESQNPEVCPELRSENQVTPKSEVTEWPKTLLLMVTYNRLQYTKLALDAVLQLDYPDLELVVSYNASSDGTVEYLKSRLDGIRHARLILSPTNKGVVSPMNSVWFSDHGAKLLVKVDNDTLVPRELLRRLAECHVRSSHFGAVSGFHFRQEGEAIADEKNVVTVNGVKVLRQRFVGGCAVMMRKEVLDRMGPIPCSSQDAADSGKLPAESPSPQPLSPQAGRGGGPSPWPSPRGRGDGPFMDGGWTWYQQRLDELGFINGYAWPFVHVDHMEDTRSPHCVRTHEHQAYKQALRGMSLEEFTQELCVWKPH